MRIMFNLFMLSIGSIFGATHLNKRYEEMVPVTVMSIIIILFAFYMLDLLLIGYFVIIISSFILILLSLRKYIIEKEIRKQSITNFFTPGLLIFGIVSFIIYLNTKDNYVMLFDELRLWALYPKSIFMTDKLMLGKDLFFSTDYYPGMPLFQYFFSKNVGYFADYHLFLSYGIAMLSLIIPITKNIKWKDYWAIIPLIILLFAFPMIFANHQGDALAYYKTLYIDPAVGITFGFSLFISTRDLKKDKFMYVLFCLSLSMIILMKVIGVILAGCVLFSYLVNQLFIYKSYKSKLKLKKENIVNYIQLILPIIVVFITFFSWKFVANIHLSSVDFLQPEITLFQRVNDASRLFLKPSDSQKDFYGVYLQTIKDTPMGLPGQLSTITIPTLLLFYITLMCIIIKTTEKRHKKIVISSTIFGLFSIFIFLAFYFYIYVFTFSSTILCFVRYISPVFSGISIMLLYLLFETKYNNKDKLLINLTILCLILLNIQNMPQVSDNVYEPAVETETEFLANKVLETVPTSKNNPANILTMFNYCEDISYSCVLYQHHLLLSLVDDYIYPIQSGMYIASEMSEVPIFYAPMNYSDLLVRLTNYDYILIVEDIENINKETKKLLGNTLNAGDIFKKIINKDGTIAVEKILKH